VKCEVVSVKCSVGCRVVYIRSVKCEVCSGGCKVRNGV